MITIIDYKGNEYPLLAIKTINEELSGQHDLELKVPQQKNNHLDLLKIDKLWEVNFQNVEYKIVYIKKVTKGDSFYLDIRAIPLFYWDFDKMIVHENKDGHYTAVNAFNDLFKGTGYQYILVDFVESIQIEGYGKGETRLEMFKRLIERLGLEFYIIGKRVYLKKLIGNDTNFMYKYKLNASNISQSIDASNYFLKISGFGNFEEGSDDYLKDAKIQRKYTSPLVKVMIKNGQHIPEGKPIIDGRIKNTSTMDANLKKAVEDSLKISIDGNLHDVRSIYKEAVPVIGDRVFLIDERIELEQEIRIHTLKRTYDVNDKLIECEVTFGSQNICNRYKSNLNSAARDFKALMNGNIKLPTWSLEGIARDMINKIHASENEVKYGDFGIQAIDKNNPNNVFGLNSQGWYISTDGGRTARTIATAEGIVADAITTGTLRSIYIEGVEVYGSRFYSSDGNTDMFIEGGNLLLSNALGRKTEINDNGIYVYSSTGELRFRADLETITSASIGTINKNFYVASDKGETRFVDIKSIPNEGDASIFDYTDVRAKTFFGNAVEVNYGLGSNIHLYLKPINGGEVRVATGSENILTNLRAHGIYANFIENHGENTNLFIRTANEVVVSARGSIDNYKPIRAARFNEASSERYKENIRKWNEDVLTKIKNEVQLYEYNLIGESPKQLNHSVIVERETPKEWIIDDGVNIREISTWAIRGVQQLALKDDDKEKRLRKLEEIIYGTN